MTQPDKNFPPSAVNKDSLGAFAAKTREDWEREQREAAAAQWAESVRQMQKLLGNVPLIGDLIEIFSGIEDGDLNDFGTAFNRWKNFWGGGLKGLLDAVVDLFQPVKDVVDGLGEFGTAIDNAVKDGVKFLTGGVAFVAGGIVGTLGAIGTAVADGLKGTQATLEGIGKAVFNLPTPEQFQGSVDGAVTWFDTAARGLMDLLGFSTQKADTAIVNNQLTNAAIYSAWTGVGGSGEVAQAQEAVAAIKTEIFKGYTAESLTYNSGTSGAGRWVRPWENPQVLAILHGEGANAATTVTDSSAAASDWVAAGGAKLTTENFKFGSASIVFDGVSGTYIRPASSTEFALGVDDFCIEMWVRPTTLSGANRVIFDFRPDGVNGAYPMLYTGTSDSKLRLYVNSADRITSTTALSVNTWYHIAVTRSGSSTKLFLNGTQEGSTYTDTSDYLCGSNRPWIGGNAFSTSGGFWVGQIDEVRITKSKARYTSNFTAPSAAFSDAVEPKGLIPKEFFVVAFGSGGGGGAGVRRITNNDSETGTSNGGAGGAAGGYIAVEVDPALLPATVAYQVGAGGTGQTSITTASASNQTNFGSYALTQSEQYFVQDILGYYTVNQSAPGVGGGGGSGDNSGSNGSAGSRSQLAGGGSGGIGSGTTIPPTVGSLGGSAPLDGKARAGGGGGGGGGGAYVQYGDFVGYYRRSTIYGYTKPYEGRLGGNGGFPGGGGGGGGGALTTTTTNYTSNDAIFPGNGGNGANGVLILLYR